MLNDEGFITFVTEVERILNDRPILLVSLDHKDLEPLTLNALLKGTIDALLPPDVFVKAVTRSHGIGLVGWLTNFGGSG